MLEGNVFGDAGAYEKLTGKVHFVVRPETEPNKFLVDLEKAPRNPAGEVEFAADVFILRPNEAARASGSVLLEIPNRGGKGLLRVIQNAKGATDPTTAEEFGDGFLMRRGVTLIWLGWQWDVRDEKALMRLYAPVAPERSEAAPGKKGTSSAQRSTSNGQLGEGKPITGLVRADFVPSEKMAEHPLGALDQRPDRRNGVLLREHN